MTRDTRKSGIAVLAYPQSGAASPVSLSLVFKCNESRAQATLCLQSSHAILQYDADNILPGTVSLGPAAIPLPQARLDALARDGNPQIRTLSLKLKKTCPVWAPSGPLTPCPGLANLARATAVHVVFDYNWLHRGQHASFTRLVERPEELSGFPVGRRYREQRYMQVDWRVFSITNEDAELPPVYAESSKRARHISSSPTPSPPSKRVCLPSEGSVHTSPTEKDSLATPSPRAPTTPVAFPPLAASLERASPPPLALHRAVEHALITLLPSVLESLIPRLLTSPSAPASPNSPASQLSTAPSPPALSALGVTLSEHVSRRMTAELETLYAHTLSHANFLRNAADDEFQMMLEEEKAALERVAEEKFGEFKEQCEGVGEDVEGCVRDGLRAERVGLEREKVSLERVRAELESEREELRRDKEELRRDKQDLRSEREDLRRERAVLRTERKAFERERRDSRCADSGNRAGIASISNDEL